MNAPTQIAVVDQDIILKGKGGGFCMNNEKKRHPWYRGALKATPRG